MYMLPRQTPEPRTHQTLFARLRFLLLEANIEPAEFGSALTAILWSISVWLVGAPALAGYGEMTHWLPSWTWGAAVFALGSTQFAMWGVGSLYARKWITLFMFCVWMCLGLFSLRGPFFTPTSILYFLPVSSCAWAYWRIAFRDAARGDNG